MSTISKYDDLIDSRDVVARIEELTDMESLDSDEQEELDSLREFAAEFEGYCPDWPHGETLIRDTYFQEYAEELARDCDLIQDDAAWPVRHIDWEAAADELKVDYVSGELDGATYWARC